MNTKTFTLIATVVTLAFASCCNYTQTSTSLKNDTDTASFYIGFNFGSQLKNASITEPNLKAFIAGINAALAGKEAPSDPQAMGMFVNQYVEKKVQEKSVKAKQEGEAFLAANKQKEGVVTTESGLQYKIEKSGDGPIPTASDVVKVHYRGTLLNGTEFDSSIKRSEPFQFQVGSGVIKGWSEAVQLMPVGSKWTLYIPSDLAYGPQGYYGIAGNETLIFEVELLEIVAQENNETAEDAAHNHEH
ncbi:MAG: FKBP-type peptidyl-prolyl cis-trans isomerase [Odoribacteraceae bacterium]|jgi:FKBP-type peptidyl-prolyl cis-trans isomerase FklB|nr:FKBP-type peptidyl-prolyl cis-trans isomerase [Odoribacteraceae bacterium]